MAKFTKPLQYQRDVVDKAMKSKVYVNHIACRDCNIRARSLSQEKMKSWLHDNEIDSMLEQVFDAKLDTELEITR